MEAVVKGLSEQMRQKIDVPQSLWLGDEPPPIFDQLMAVFNVIPFPPASGPRKNEEYKSLLSQIEKQVTQRVEAQLVAQLKSKAWADQGCYDLCPPSDPIRGCKRVCFDAISRWPTKLYGAEPAERDAIQDYSRALYAMGGNKKMRTGHFGLNPYLNDNRTALPILNVCMSPIPWLDVNIRFPCICGSDLGSDSVELWKYVWNLSTPC
ncbi:hypothetical protein EJ08DRAFT_477221 [Tothia fuscella]|uniref:Uncharacterized protein n=1 Tax=Tothia fuscella TaxID=1048955 RepID=A0A9P4NIE1_9PEZI|nr:hypothetical protein EJ08DRAFT_477221 [Tothia fuscella]